MFVMAAVTVDTDDVSKVVPARPGPIFELRVFGEDAGAFTPMKFVVMGPGLRQDDTLCAMRADIFSTHPSSRARLSWSAPDRGRCSILPRAAANSLALLRREA